MLKSGGTITLNGTGNSIDVVGTGAAATANNTTVKFENGAGCTITGSFDTITAGSNSAINQTYALRPGLPVRNCDRDTPTLGCPPIRKRLWADGAYPAN